MGKPKKEQQKPTPTFFVRVHHNGEMLKLNVISQTISFAIEAGLVMWRQANKPTRLIIKDQDLIVVYQWPKQTNKTK